MVAIAKMLERRRQGMGDTETQNALKLSPLLVKVFWGLNEPFAEVKRIFQKAAKRERNFRSAGLFLIGWYVLWLRCSVWGACVDCFVLCVRGCCF